MRHRLNLLLISFLLLGILVAWRLFHWQIIQADQLQALAEAQHWASFEVAAKRGEIMASDGFPLVANEEAFLVFASLPDLELSAKKIASQIAPLLVQEEEDLIEMENLIKARLSRQDLVWVPIKHKIPRATKEVLEDLEIKGLGFEREEKRGYSEGSSAAHLLGFVGSDINGRDKGYFGLEGYYDLELKGRSGMVRREKDASGKPILVGEFKDEGQKDGRTLVTTINRAVQFVLDKKLQEGILKYGAKSGSVIVMESETGAILGMSSWPVYDPANFSQFDKTLFPNPIISAAYEPGSTFKILVMAAALDSGMVKPETKCDKCSGPRHIADYTIETYDNQYHPDSTMIEVIEHSDNVGMVFAAEKLGLEKMLTYLKKFEIGELTGIDLEEETTPSLRAENEWRLIDLATASFGQGIAVTPLQMLRAAGVIANQGQLVTPFVVKEVRGTGAVVKITPAPSKKVIAKKTAQQMTEIMVNAVEKGWFANSKPSGFKIAGKTGTAQIPIAGHYDKEKTIASFVGFAPADESRFVMLVTLRESTSSPWGANTAAPLWFDIAKDLLVYYQIMPDL